MTLNEATTELSEKLYNDYPMCFTVGNDQKDKIYVYQLKKVRNFPDLKRFQGYEVVLTYTGTISPATEDVLDDEELLKYADKNPIPQKWYDE